MTKIQAPVLESYRNFSDRLPAELESALSLTKGSGALEKSYARVAAFNAIKRDLISGKFLPGAKRFVDEAHNDLLVSHVCASMGSWRAALQSLRSFVENVMAGLYYNDHRVELELRSTGGRISPRELREYFSTHPDIRVAADAYELKNSLDKEYGELSKAVHAANNLFRMSDENGTIFAIAPDVAELGKWAKREHEIFQISILIIFAYFKDKLKGAAMGNLRSALEPLVSERVKKILLEKCAIVI